MLKSGLIAGAVSFVLVVVAALFAPVCAVCVGLFLGIGAGFLAGVFDGPGSAAAGARSGAGAGAIAGLSAIVGQMLSAAGLAAFFPEGSQYAAELVARWTGAAPVTLTAANVWAQQLGIGCCVGLINLGLMAALGAGGGALWYQMRGAAHSVAPPAAP